MTSSRFIGILWVLAQFSLLALWVVAAFALPESLRSVLRFTPLTVLSIAFMLLGVVLALSGAIGLGAALTPSPEPKKGAQLVRTGIYSRVRHPIYGGILLIVWGGTIPLLTPLTALAALAITLFFDAKARYEERRLCERFPAYPEYVKRTWRFIPKPAISRRA